MIYSAVDTSDVHAAVLHIQRKFPEAPISLAGFSLGAMLVTKYLADIESGTLQPAGLSPYDLSFHLVRQNQCPGWDGVD